MDTSPEYESIESFVDFLMEDERTSFNHDELGQLAYSLRRSLRELRHELEGWGLALEARPHERAVRGINSNPHDRWYGPGACRTHGGSGWEQITGFAGRRG